MTTNPSTDRQSDSSQPTDADDPVRVPPTVYAQFEALRQSGLVNMKTEILEGLERFEFVATCAWLETNPKTYHDGLSRGFAPTEPDAVDPIDPDALRAAVPDDLPQRDRTDAATPLEQYVLDHLESVRRLSPAAAEYYAEGTWRTPTPLTAAERAQADRFTDAIDCRPRQCYRNAQLVAATFGDECDLTYVEGYALSPPPAIPVQHAWLELNGTILELTFPEGPEPDMDVAYLGIAVPLDAVHEHTAELKTGAPVAPRQAAEPATQSGRRERHLHAR